MDRSTFGGKEYNLSEFVVLVINENAFMANIIAQMLRSFGVKQVVLSRNTEDAIRALEAQSFDFMLLDLMIEPMNGIEFMKLIRAHKKRGISLIPIIIITGNSARRNVELARDGGANEFIRAPLSASTLFDRIAALIDRPRPFIRTRTFFGPDRRRRRMPDFDGPYRRAADRKRLVEGQSGDPDRSEPGLDGGNADDIVLVPDAQ